LLAFVAATGPLSMQIFVPALPAIARDFAVEPAIAQLTLSASMVAVGISTLCYGPLSDRFGRRPILLLGLWVFLLGSFACAVAGRIDALIVARIVQAAGGAAGMVLARAMARDLHDASGAAVAISRLTMVMVVAPTIAPFIGGVCHDLAGWRAIFWLVTALGVVALALCHREVRESAPASPSSPRHLLRGFGELLGDSHFVVLMLYPAFSSMIFFSFISGAPYVMVELLGRPVTEYGLYFMLVAGGYIVGSYASSRLIGRISGLDLMTIGMAIAVVGILTLVAIQSLGVLSPLGLCLPLMVSQIGQGLGLPNAQAAAINVFPARAGTASALTGFVQMMSAAVASQLVGMLQNGSAWPLIILLTIAAIAALTVSVAARTMARG